MSHIESSAGPSDSVVIGDEIFDRKPTLGLSDPEPSIRMMLTDYYGMHFSAGETKNLVDRYIADLKSH